MPSVTTVFRTIVMLAVGVIAVKGWQAYGPSGERVKAMTARAIEIAYTSWQQSQLPAGPQTSLTVDPHGAAPPFTGAQSLTAPAPFPEPGAAPIALSSGANELVAATSADPIAPAVFTAEDADSEASSPNLSKMPAMGAADADRLQTLVRRLKELGGVDPQLVAWGASGQLYRFCCRAALADSPNFTRHFESVAAEPLVAVEDVLAKVEAWRTARAPQGQFR